MAREFDHDVANYLATAADNVPATVPPFSMGGWFRPVGTVGGADTLMALSGDPFNFRYHRIYRTQAAAAVFNAHSNSNGSQATASGTVSVNTDEWSHVVAVFAADDDRRIYTNGGDEQTDATSRPVGAINRFSIGALLRSSVSDPYDGACAWPFFYDIALPAWAIAALAAGADPRSILPEHLVAMPWMEGDGDALDLTGGGFDLIETGTVAAFAEEPTVALGGPWFAQVAAAAGGGAHTITGAGSIALTGAAAMLEGRVLAGAGAVSLTGAAQMAEGRVLDGAGSIALAGTAALEGPENAIDGAGTIALAGLGVMLEGRVLAGAGAIALTGAGAMLEGRVIAGAGAVELTGAAALEGPQNELVGAGVVALTGLANMLEGRVLDGAGAISLAGAAQMLEGRVLDATGQIALTGAAVMAHTAIGSATIADVYTLLRQLALGKVVTRRATGTYELYDPDTDALAYTGPLFEDEAETTAFGPDSDGADVRGKLEPP